MMKDNPGFPETKEHQNKLILEIKNLTKSFGGLRAIDDVSLSLRRGELRCLIGPNGAGKSTLFKLIVGSYNPNSGKIYYNGKDITKLQSFERIRNGISIKFQTPTVYQDLSLYHNLSVPLQRYRDLKKIDEEIDGLLTLFNLKGKENFLARELSHGQRQWLEVAMAFATRPQLLLLDEPTGGMSLDETSETAKIITRLNKKGTTIIVVEHDMAFVRQTAQKITVLHYGKILAEGELSQIESHSEVRRIYLGEANEAIGRKQ